MHLYYYYYDVASRDIAHSSNRYFVQSNRGSVDSCIRAGDFWPIRLLISSAWRGSDKTATACAYRSTTATAAQEDVEPSRV